MGKIGVLVQHGLIRLKNGQKLTKMVENGETSLKMAIAIAGLTTHSETVSHASPVHMRVVSGCEVAFLKAVGGFLDHF